MVCTGVSRVTRKAAPFLILDGSKVSHNPEEQTPLLQEELRRHLGRARS